MYAWYPDRVPGSHSGAIAASAPVLVIRSGADRIVPPAVADRFVELLPGARLAELPQAGHQADLEHPEELAALVTGFLASA